MGLDDWAELDGLADGLAEDEPVELTEDGVALAFTRRFADRARFDHEIGHWFWWSPGEGIWCQDGKRDAADLCRQIARAGSAAAKDSLKGKVRSKSFAYGAEALAQNDPMHAVTHEVWDRDTMLLGCPGLTVDLRTGEGRAPAAEDFITRSVAVAPDFHRGCPTWLKFLDEATGGDDAMVAFLQTVCGYTLTGETREHAIFYLYGVGGTGKSTFLNTLRGVMGDYAQPASMQTFVASKYESHSTDVAAMRGARLVAVSEVTEGKSWDEAKTKQLTGGDAVRARFMRKDDFTFRPTFKLMIVANHRPAIRNVDDGMKRRLRMIPFDHRPATPDPHLEEKLREQWPAILAWMIRGCRVWLEEGLGQPDAVVKATAEYFSEQDLLSQWLEERCYVAIGDRNVWGAAAELYADWRKYAEAAGEHPGSVKRFGEWLMRQGFVQERQRVVGVLARGWIGVRLLGLV